LEKAHTRRVQPTCAIIVRLTRLTETSLIVHWFSEAHGLLKTVAKGARRPKSQYAGKIDLFFGGEISVIQARRGELHQLGEVEITAWREGLRRSYVSTLLAAYFCQLLEAAVEPEHPEPGLHDLLRRALDHLDTQPASLRAMRHFESELARHLGVSHDPERAEVALRDSLGKLPASRDELMERLSSSEGFGSSPGKNQR
jgi:DNA repair protein RecO (recombination protein O)